MTVSGSVNGEAYRRTVPISNVGDDAEYLPRTWAKLAIDDMVARDAEKNKSQVIELSKSMYVMSPFTSLLVLENDQMYEQYNVDRGRKDHWALYPCPEEIKVVHEPLHGPQPAETSDPNDKPTKPSLEEVLRTLLVRNRNSDGNGTLASVEWIPHFAHVPDSGTVLLGGIKRRIGINAKGLPLLGKFPYANRLFRNGRFDGEVDYLMLMVTPSLIIQEEEEELLSVQSLAFPDRLTWDIDNDGDGAMTDFDSLIDVINMTVAPDTWEAVGGRGSINAWPSNLSLVISQTQRVHDPISAGFESLGTVVFPAEHLVAPITLTRHGDFGTVGFITDGATNINLWNELSRRRIRYASGDLAARGKSERRILAELDKTTEFIYQDQPLEDVIADLRRRHDIPIAICTEAIEESGIAADSPITMNISDITLRSGLRLMLAELDLTYFITDDVLQITTPEDMENQLVSRNCGFDDLLLLIRRGRSGSPREHGSTLNDPRFVDRWARILNQRLSQGSEQPNLLYPQAETVTSHRSFRRLLDFAPATTTTRADALAVLEAEARLNNRPELGRVDDRARELIETARAPAGS